MCTAQITELQIHEPNLKEQKAETDKPIVSAGDFNLSQQLLECPESPSPKKSIIQEI